MRGHHVLQSMVGSLIVSAFVLGSSATAAAPVVRASPAIHRTSDGPVQTVQTGVRVYTSYGPYYSYSPGYYGYGYSYGYRPRFRSRFYRPYSYSVYSYGTPYYGGYVGSTYATGYRGYPGYYYAPRSYYYAPPAYYGYYRPGYRWYGGYYFGYGW
ncbi:MAG: hypothetical protein ACF8TS_04700 [Maioricimonas sp. JB049]